MYAKLAVTRMRVIRLSSFSFTIYFYRGQYAIEAIYIHAANRVGNAILNFHL